jgi:hypothetical protein
MSYLLFEIWTEEEDGHQELIDTTASKTEAIKIAEQSILDGSFAAVILQETEDGDLEEVLRFESD